MRLLTLTIITILAQPVRGQDREPAQPEEAPLETSGLAEETGASDPTGAATPALDPRFYLTGDWNGKRTTLAEKGLTFDVNWTQVTQGVVSGGLEPGWKYGGKLEYLATLDLGKMDVMPGGFVRVMAESRYGRSVNGTSGAALPENTSHFFPLTDELDEGIPITVSELSYTQFFSPKFGVTLGKLQTLDGDPNEFASGRGRSQFLNMSFVAPNLAGLAVPYSTLGAGVIVIPNEHVSISSLVVSANDSSTTTGFENLGNGTTWLTEARFQYRLGELPGGQNIGFAYAFDKDFRAFNRPGLPGGENTPFEDDTWTLYWSLWQYLFTLDDAPAMINPGDGRPDMRGLGLFARAGVVDEDTSLARWGVSLGVGGRGLIPNRDEDTFGVGIGYVEFSNDLPLVSLLIEDQAVVFEAFYNAAIAPGIALTGDIQVFQPTRRDVDTTIVLGCRLNVRF